MAPTPPTKARRYLRRSFGVIEFFQVLKENNVDYVVLRWFETLPNLAPGEDIDLLVADQDLAFVETLFTGVKGKDLCVDVYSVSGLPGSDFRGVPYFPETVARQILTTARWQNGLIRVPAPLEHFLSMAFHALYHKGFGAGIPAKPEEPPPAGDFEHSYATILSELAERAGVSLASCDMASLDRMLIERAWKPRPDTLEKWASKNGWLRQQAEASRAPLEPYWSGFIVFLVREEGLALLEGIKDLMWEEGLNFLADVPLTGDLQQRAAAGIRGGNWGRGPHPRSGGLPAYALAAFDVFPQDPDPVLRKEHPGITNARIALIKHKVRGLSNGLRPESEWCNVIHSSDNAWQALEYADLTMPALREALEQRCRELTEQFRTPYPVLRNLSNNSRRAKVELVLFQGREAICKTFRPERQEYLQRELRAREIPGAEHLIAPILSLGERHLVVKKFGPRPAAANSPFPLFFRGKFIHPRNVSVARKLLLAFRQAGYEVLDFKASNWFFDEDGSMKLVDLEFLTYTGIAKNDLRGCLAWYPLPSHFQGRRPLNRRLWKNPYGLSWFGFLGIPRSLAVLDLPPSLVMPLQSVFGFVFLGIKLGRALASRTRDLKTSAKTVLKRVLRRLR